MTNYKNAHLWLIIPFILIMLGFLPSYWLALSDAPWRHHLHGLTATAWFLLVILQPYLITRGHREQHRRFGMFGLVLAGGVAFSALGLIPFNFDNPFFSDTMKYGLSFIDFVLVPGFLFAVVMAVRTAHRPDDHARWMISTVFWAISPGLFRVFLMPLFIFGVEDVGPKVPLLLAAAGLANLIVLAILMLRDRRFHPAYTSAAIGSLVLFPPMAIGDMLWWRSFADALFSM